MREKVGLIDIFMGEKRTPTEADALNMKRIKAIMAEMENEE